MIFRDGPDRVKQILPFSAFDSGDPEKLWEFLASYEKKTGGRVLAIPHNGNISNGQMYAEVIKGQDMTRDYAERRARWEPLMEATQEKGDGETHPVLSPEDEFADFETWDFGDSMGNPKEDGMLQYEYARSTLKNGIRLEDKLGVNPYKYGMVGSTDSHVSLTTTREENYFGKLPNEEPSAKRTSLPFLTDKKTGDVIVSTWQLGASGLAAVWARENTREAIFDALARKEVYATTGTRMTVRVFAGWDFQPDEVLRPDFAAQGYARGVPMGGDLAKALQARRHRSWFGRSAIPTAPTSIASRSSRAGSTRTVRHTSASTTSPVPTAATIVRSAAARRRSAARWTSPTRATPTPSGTSC